MVIRKMNNDFTLTFESEFDKREKRREGLFESHELAAMICNSNEMDFEYVDEDAYGNINLYNTNTNKYYTVYYRGGVNFFDGLPITLYARDYL